MDKVSIIIVNWNGLRHLKKCLLSLSKLTYKNVEVIVVDNNSADGSVNFIKKKYPDVHVVVNKKNLGYAEANNVGYKKSTGDFILFLNNDTVVTKNFLKGPLFELSKFKDTGCIQCELRLMDEPQLLDSVGAYLTSTGFLYHYGIAKPIEKKYLKKINIYSAKGAAMICRREVLEKVLLDESPFDREYFAYFEESDLCHRIWLAGYKTIYLPNTTVFHKMGGTSVMMNSSFIQYHSFKNRIRTYIKNFQLSTMISILPMHLFISFIYSVLCLLKFDFTMIFSIFNAVLWNMINIGDTLRLRKIVQNKIRTVDDKTIINIIKKDPRPEYYFYLLVGLQRYLD